MTELNVLCVNDFNLIATFLIMAIVILAIVITGALAAVL